MKAVHHKYVLISILSMTGASVADCQQPGKKGAFSAAKSQGTDQSGFVMTIKPTETPFCNLGEVGVNPARTLESVHLPALVTAGVCQQSQPIWELSDVVSAPSPFRVNGVWSTSNDVWKSALQGMDLGSQSGPVTTLQTAATQNQSDISVKPWPNSSLKVAQHLELLVDSPNHPELVLADVKTISTNEIDLTITSSGVWSRDHSVGSPVQILTAKGGGKCIAGTLETLLERSYQYGFCSDKLNNVSLVKPPSIAFDLSASDYYVVNIVVWDKTDKDGYSVKSSRWYTVNYGDHGTWYRQRLPTFPDALRVYGTKKPIGLIAIHIHDAKDINWSDFQKLSVKYTVTVKTKTATNVSDFQNAVSIIEGGAKALGLPDPDGFYGASFFKAGAPADITISSEVTFPSTHKPTPAQTSEATASAKPKVVRAVEVVYRNSTRLALMDDGVKTTASLLEDRWVSPASVFEPQQSAPAAKSTTNTGGTWNGKKGSKSPGSQSTTTNASSPSVTCQAAASGKDQSPCTLMATVNDENLYHWDVAFAVPFKTLTDLSYQSPSSTTGTSTVVPKTVTRENAYALFEFYPIAADIITPPTFSVPHIFASLPISGKVFNKPMFGAGEGINLKSLLKVIPLQVQLFGGLVYNKEFRQIPGTTGSSNVAGHRVWNGTYGIEIPVGQFKSLVSSKSAKSKISGGTTTSNTASIQ